MNGRFLRIAISACAFLAVVAGTIAFAVLPRHVGHFGLALAAVNGDWSIASIQPDSAASRAGLRTGDVIDAAQMSLDDRITFASEIPDVPAHLIISRLGQHIPITVTAARVQLDPSQLLFRVATLVFALVYALVALLIAFKAPPSPATTAILAFILGIAMNAVCDCAEYLFSQPYHVLLAGLAGSAFVSAILSGQFAFPMLFPARSTKAWRAIAIVGTPLTVLYIIVWQWSGVRFFLAQPFNSTFQSWLGIAFAVVVITAIVNSVLSSTPDVRRQALWAAAGILIPLLGYAARSVCTLEGWNTTWVTDTYVLWYGSGLAVTYAVLRHRLGGLELFVSRAATFSVVSLALICAFLLSEWGIALILEHVVGERFNATGQMVLAAFIALVVGLSARSVHEVISHRLNRLFFARRYRALEALHRFSLETDSAMDGCALTNLAVRLLERHVGAHYIAIYRGSPEDGYMRQQSEDPGLPVHLTADDEVVLRLRRWNEPFVNEEKTDYFTNAYVCPMTVRGSLRGFVVCGPKNDRAVYLPDERESLASLTHRVGVALEWLGRPEMAVPNMPVRSDANA